MQPTSNEQVDTAGHLNFLLEFVALLHQVSRIAVEHVSVGRVDVDVSEEVLPHVGVVALWVVARQADVLVHVERLHVLERELAGLVELDQLAVHPQRSAACVSRDEGKTQVHFIQLGCSSRELAYGFRRSTKEKIIILFIFVCHILIHIV